MERIAGCRNVLALLAGLSLLAGTSCPAADAGPPVAIENEHLKCVLGADGSPAAFIDKQSGTDYCVHSAGTKFARLTRAGKAFPATQAALADGKLTVKFGDAGVTAVLAVEVKPHYFTLETLSVSGDDVSEMVFFDLPLKCRGHAGGTVSSVRAWR